VTSASDRVLGIDVGGTAIKIAVVWSDGHVARADEIPTLADAGPEQAVGRILDCGRKLLDTEGVRRDELRVVGMDSAGIVDLANGLVLDAPNLRSWECFPLAARLGDALGVPVFLENDVNAMTYAEWQLGAGTGARHLVCLTLGTGVGGGLVLDGRLYRGARHAGGELGHMTLQRDGPRCPCGSTGCLERYIGTAAIVERTRRHLERDERPSRLRETPAEALTPRAVSEAAAAGDAIARGVLEETGRWLGVGLASLANIFDPERIIIGGGVAKAGDLLLEPARAMLRERAMKVPAERVLVVPAALGNQASVAGAALLALGRVQG
jgi:glucokinase